MTLFWGDMVIGETLGDMVIGEGESSLVSVDAGGGLNVFFVTIFW